MKYLSHVGLLLLLVLTAIQTGRAQPGSWGYNQDTYYYGGVEYYSLYLAAGNLDGSGRTTVVTANYETSSLSVYTNDGLGNLTWSYDYFPTNCLSPLAVTMATNLLGNGSATVTYLVSTCKD